MVMTLAGYSWGSLHSILGKLSTPNKNPDCSGLSFNCEFLSRGEPATSDLFIGGGYQRQGSWLGPILRLWHACEDTQGLGSLWGLGHFLLWR